MEPERYSIEKTKSRKNCPHDSLSTLITWAIVTGKFSLIYPFLQKKYLIGSASIILFVDLDVVLICGPMKAAARAVFSNLNKHLPWLFH